MCLYKLFLNFNNATGMKVYLTIKREFLIVFFFLTTSANLLSNFILHFFFFYFQLFPYLYFVALLYHFLDLFLLLEKAHIS